jgi:hypothetical protein
MAAPGIVLKRPVGSSAPFREHADLPTDIAADLRVFFAVYRTS